MFSSIADLLKESIAVGWSQGFVLMIAFVGLSLWRWEAGLAFTSALFYLIRGFRLPIGMLLNYVMLLQAGLLCYQLLKGQWVRSRIGVPAMVGGLLLFAAQVASYWFEGRFDPNNAEGGPALIRTVTSEIFPFLGLLVVGADVRVVGRYLAWLAVWLGFAMVIYGIGILASPGSGVQISDIRAQVHIFHYQLLSFGDFAAIAAIIGLALISDRLRTDRWVVAFSYTAVAVGLVVAGGSRMAVFALLLTLSWMLRRLRVAGRNFGLAALLMVLLAVPFAAIAAYQQSLTAFGERMGAMWLVQDADALTSGRLGAWQYAWKAFWDSPVIGVGYGAGGPIVMNHTLVATALEERQQYRMNVHNAYLQVIAEQGAVGAALLVFFLGAVVWLCFRCPLNERLAHGRPEGRWLLVGCGMVIFALISGFTGGFTLLYPAAAVVIITYSHCTQRLPRPGFVATRSRQPKRVVNA